jgi:hypothetical protein
LAGVFEELRDVTVLRRVEEEARGAEEVSGPFGLLGNPGL